MSAMSALIALPRLPRLVFLSSLRNLAEKLLRPSGSISLPVSSAAALILSACGYVFYKWYRLSHIPGPFWTPWSFFRLLARGRVYEDFPALNRKYGPLVRIGPNVVMYSDSETFGRVTGVRSLYTKGSFYTSVKIPPCTGNVFSETGAEEHKAMRAKLAGGYSGRENGGFEPTIDNNIARLTSLIESKYISTPGDLRPLEMAKKAQFFSLDVVSEVGHGKPFGFIREDSDLHGFLGETDAYWPMLALIVCLPGLTELFGMWPLRTVMPRVGGEKGAGALFGHARDNIDERLKSGERGFDMPQSFIDAGLSRYELEQEMFVETLAGSDTVATAIRMTLLCLLTTPKSYLTLQSELDAAAAAGKLNSPPRDAEARALPYLQAVIREALRRYPPATGLMTKVVPEGGDIVHGKWVPGGTELAVNIVGIMGQEEVFGGDVGVFRPERWLVGGNRGEGEGKEEEEECREREEARLRRMVSTVDMVFGGGKNTCPGRTIALIEINKVIPELLRRYDMAIVRPEKPLGLFHGIFWVTSDFHIRFTRRETVRL